MCRFLFIALLLTPLGCGGGASKAKYSDFDTPRAVPTAK
jgi:hypothetical protein